MRIDLNDAARGGVALRGFTFPDGQPHYEINANDVGKAAAVGPNDVIASLQSGGDLLRLDAALEAIKSVQCEPPVFVRLTIANLLGVRMDRRIGVGQPATAETQPELGFLRALIEVGVLG
jgi:hypothetical protein